MLKELEYLTQSEQCNAELCQITRLTYICDSLLQLMLNLNHDLPQAEIKILLFQAEKFYKMTPFFTQSCPWEKSQLLE